MALAVFWAVSSEAQKVVQPKAGPKGSWRLLGRTEASHTADHDTIIVQRPFDNFRSIKFKVINAPLDMERMVVTYDNVGRTGLTCARTSRREAKAGPSICAALARGA